MAPRLSCGLHTHVNVHVHIHPHPDKKLETYSKIGNMTIIVLFFTLYLIYCIVYMFNAL